MNALTSRIRLVLIALSFTILAACSGGGGGGDTTTNVPNSPKGNEPIKVTAITISPQNPMVKVGEPLQLKAMIAPENATNKVVVWASNDDAIISVSNTGVVTANADSGSATITATAQDGSGIRGSITVTAVAKNELIKVTAITLSPQNGLVKVGEPLPLTAMITPANATNQAVTWASSDTATISVSNAGLVTANAAAGSATITATAQDGSGIRGSTTVTIEIRVTAITLSPQNAIVKAGEPLQIRATVAPTNATNQAVTWASSDSATISVSSTGLVTANVDSGSVTITATAQDGSGIRGSTTVTIEIRVETITLSPQNGTAIKGGTPVQLTATVAPTNATNQAVTWTSSDDSIISVSNSGLATANAESGSVTITATAQDGSGIRGSATVNAALSFCSTATPCLHVTSDTSGNGNGSSWATPLSGLQAALDQAKMQLAQASNPPRTVRIFLKGGTYRPSKTLRGMACDTSSTYSDCTFVMQNNVEIYGGFAGTETSLADRTLSANTLTTLDGLLNPSAAVTACPAGNANAQCSLSVINNDYTGAAPLTASAVLDGVVVRNARGINNAGSGMFNNNASPTIRNVTFSGNTADQGGGMNNANSSPLLTNVTFSGNSASFSGGGMYNDSSSPRLTNVTFSSNAAGFGGGMNNVNSSSPLLTNVTFSGNTAGAGGGGMNNLNSSSPLLTNVTFSGNTAGAGGGGMSNFTGSSPLLTNVTFSGNSANLGGGGMDNFQSSPILTNVTFFGNSAAVAGGNNVSSDGRSNLAVINTVVWGDGILNSNDSSYTAYSSLIQGVAADTNNGNLDGVAATTAGIFGNSALADNGNPFAQTVAIAANSPAASKGALVWKSGADYYASKGSGIFIKLTGTGTGTIDVLPAGATLVSTGGANKNNTVTPTAGPPAIYPDIGAYQH